MSRTEPGYQVVSGSERIVHRGARRVRDAAPDAVAEVTVVLRRATAPATQPARIDPADAERLLGAADADVTAVTDFAAEHGLSVTSVHRAARSVALSGTVAQLSEAFQVRLGEYEYEEGTYRGREGAVQVPAGIAAAVVAVLGLDNRPQALPRFRLGAMDSGPTTAGVGVPGPVGTAYPPRLVAQAYQFPPDADGAGQTIAVIELGGGYRPEDLQRYFQQQNVPTPEIIAVGNNAPGSPADGEVCLDIEVIGAIAPGARQIVYFANSNTTDGFYQVLGQAVHDQIYRPSVISISWGLPENTWTPQAMDSFDALFADCASLGISVFAAAGDSGATGASTDGSLQVDFPASSPHAIGCGGTRLTAEDETVWNDLPTGGATGGGVSRYFAVPEYQANAGVPLNPDNRPGRGVPDVAGNADPQTGYQVLINGADQVMGGTSAVAPLWSALTAIINQITGRRTGALHPLLYGPASTDCLAEIISGNNGFYQAGPGWNACTGQGRPVGDQLAKIIADAPTVQP